MTIKTNVIAEYTATNGVTIDGVQLKDSGITMTPVTAPIAATGTVSAGGLVDDGSHYYRVTYTTAEGETGFGTVSAEIVCGTGNNIVTLAIPISTDARVTGRKIYRGSESSPYYRLLTTISNNTADSYVDNIANASLPATGSQNLWDTTAGSIYVGSTLVGYVGPSVTQLGHGGLANVTTGFDNSGFGWNTLAAVTTGYNLTAVGVNVLQAATTATNITAVGVHAGQDLVSSNNATLIGVNAGRKKISGDYDTAVGVAALFNNTDGEQNTIVGVSAFESNVNGDRNIALGFQAGYYETGSDKLFIDNRARASEAAGRTDALIYGVMNATVSSQTLRFNAKTGVNMAPYGNQWLSIAGNEVGLWPLTATSYGYFAVQNGSCQVIFGVEASAGANIFPGTSAYSAVFGTPNNYGMHLVTNNTVRMTISNAGGMGFFGHAAAAQPAKASHNNWAAVSDVVAALVEIGIFDTA